MPDNSIANLGELSKPVTVLIEKILDAVGGIFKPNQIVRIAKAKAETKRIQMVSEIEVSDIQSRTFSRLLDEEAKKQKNMEDITKQAIADVDEKATPEKINDDWITNFFDKCRLISDSQMQSLWSRILAGEANSPNTFSKRTVNCLSSLDKLDADLFTKLCKFCWKLEHEILPVIYDYQSEICNKHKINFDTLNHLQSIGLIRFAFHSGFTRLKIPKKLNIYYYL